MEKTKHIAFIAIPTLITEGILAVLKPLSKKFKIYSFESFQELAAFPNKSLLNLVLLNSNIPEYDIKQTEHLKNDIFKATWIGIITGNPNRNFITTVEDVIYLNDDTHKIFEIIKKSLIVKKSENKNNHLSDRETDVLKLLVKGKTNKEIANELNISIHTVITHRKNITHKLGIKSAAAMAIYAVANNIIDLNDSTDLV